MEARQVVGYLPRFLSFEEETMGKMPEVAPREAAACEEALLEQEEVLRYKESFDSAAALELGCALAGLEKEFSETYVVQIVRAADAEVVFQWLPDDKGTRNLDFAAGKIAETLATGHASCFRQIEALKEGEGLDALFAEAPERLVSAGAFPIYADGELTAVIGVSGLHQGLDHEAIVRALEQVLGKSVRRFPVALA